MENAQNILSAGLEFFFAVISVILLMGCLLEQDKERKTNRMMIAILTVHSLMNIIDACVWLWCDAPKLLVPMKLLSFISYALGCAVMAMFSFLLIYCAEEHASVPKLFKKTIIGLSSVMIILCFISVFNGMYYYWDENGVCHTGKLFWLSQVLGVVIYILDILLVFAYRKTLKKRNAAVLILYCAIPLLSYIFIPLWDVTPLYTAMTIVLLLYYIVIHVEHGQRAAEQKTQLVRQELELADSRTAIVLTQIRPHFLYNSLTAIAQLCEKNPVKAKETTLNFSEYLRQNMNSLEQKAPISFKKELEHLKYYLAIEQVRFGDALRIVYHIEVADFLIPALSLQPIVENAVKHGVGMKENGGTVEISARLLSGLYEITVSDDGVGFDISAVTTDNKTHIGIKNVRERLEKLVGGTIQVNSRINIGTTVIIRIPKEG